MTTKVSFATVAAWLGWASAVALAPPTAARPAAAQALAGAADHAAYNAGVADRRHWEDWFATRTGEARDGARWWSGQRSKGDPGTCRGSPAFITGCLDARTILAPTDLRRRADPDYRRGWNSVAGAPDPGRLAPRDDPAAWREGLRDRAEWETWFAGLGGDRRAGALYWATERSKPVPGTCANASADFAAACAEAQQRLAAPDRRRHTDADYWRGWNSYGVAPSPDSTPPAATRPLRAGAGGTGDAPCADAGTLGRLCVGQTETTVMAALGPPLGRLTRRCDAGTHDAGTPDERDCDVWYYVHDCGRYTILFDRPEAGDWRLLAIGFTQPASPDERAQWCGAHG